VLCELKKEVEEVEEVKEVKEVEDRKYAHGFRWGDRFFPLVPLPPSLP
jgi:hypothetical protein